MFNKVLGQTILILSLVFTLSNAEAGLNKHPFYSEEFYQAYDAKDIPRLKTELKKLLRAQHRPLTYKQARKVVFNKLFIDNNSNVLDVYCHKIHKVDPRTMPSSNVLNVEHTWPQSKFTTKYPAETQKTDLNILYPVDAKANTSRSNHPFGVIVKDVDGPCPGKSHRGYTNSGADIRFEPPQVHKGNVARSIFYFALQYDMTIDKEQKEDLLKWNRLDPVEAVDEQRNSQIETIQGNRNPYIDYPELVELLAP